jgi:hypothetical protein
MPDTRHYARQIAKTAQADGHRPGTGGAEMTLPADTALRMLSGDECQTSQNHRWQNGCR